MELPDQPIFASIDAAAITLLAHAGIYLHPLWKNLVSLQEYRNRHCGGGSASSSPPAELFAATHAFLRARRHVPVARNCLPDSMALVRFLSRRKLFANLVIGVTLQPFSAHSWVQSGPLALNETVSVAGAHTPIMVA